MVDPGWPLLWGMGVFDTEEEKEEHKELWELTRKEWWQRTSTKWSDRGKVMLLLPNKQNRETLLTKVRTDDNFIEDMKVLKDIAFQAYREEIEKALKENKRVPIEILKEEGFSTPYLTEEEIVEAREEMERRFGR